MFLFFSLFSSLKNSIELAKLFATSPFFLTSLPYYRHVLNNKTMPCMFIRITRNTLHYSGSVHFSGCKIKAVRTITNSQDWYSLPTLKCSREMVTTCERVGGQINGDCGCCLTSAVFSPQQPLFCWPLSSL